MRIVLSVMLLIGGLAVAMIMTGQRDVDRRLNDVAGVTDPIGGGEGGTNAAPPPAGPASAVSGARAAQVEPNTIQARTAVSRTTEASIAVPMTVVPSSGSTRTEQLNRNGGPAAAPSRTAVLRDLQHELKRVGCFKGRVGEDWERSTRPAMDAFLERTNGALPTEQPDEILLTMVRATPGHVCGAGCPRGQSLSNGSCVPDAILARPTEASPGRQVITSVPGSLTDLPGGAGGPREAAADEAVKPAPKVKRAPRSQSVAASPQGRDNWVQRAFSSAP